jgi:hypothetical protein
LADIIENPCGTVFRIFQFHFLKKSFDQKLYTYADNPFNYYNFINRKMHFNCHLCAFLFCFAAATLCTSICGGAGAAGELTQRHPKNASTFTTITEENNQNDDDQGKLK